MAGVDLRRKVVAEHLAWKIKSHDAKASVRHFGTNIELIALAALWLSGMPDWSLVHVAAPPGRRRLANVDFGACGIERHREVNFVTGSNMGGEHTR